MTLISTTLSARAQATGRADGPFGGLTPESGEADGLPADFAALIEAIAGEPGSKRSTGEEGRTDSLDHEADTPTAIDGLVMAFSTPPISAPTTPVSFVPATSMPAAVATASVGKGIATTPPFAPVDAATGSASALARQAEPLSTNKDGATHAAGADTSTAPPLDTAMTPTTVLNEDFTQAARQALGAVATDRAVRPAMPAGAKTNAAPAPTPEGETPAPPQVLATLGTVLPDMARPDLSLSSPKDSATAALLKTAPASTATPIATDTAMTNDREPGDGSSAGGEKSQRRVASEAPASTAASAGQPLRDIVQSLPPIVQTQIGLAGTVVTGTATVQPANTAQALDAQVIDMGVSGQWIDRMAREISALAEGPGHSRFTLMPPHLGRIEISLKQSEASTAVHFATETDEAADRIRAAQGNLQADARLSALSIGTITVEKSQQSFDQANRDGSTWAGGSRQGADSNAQAGAQSQSGGQGLGGRESGKNSARQAVNHLSDTPEQARRDIAARNPGVRFA